MDPETRKAVETGLRTYNDSRSPVLRGYRERGEDKEEPFDLYAYDDADELAAGIVAATWGGWLAIDLVWVREDQRGSGLGADLLRRIEERGAGGAGLRRCPARHLGLPGEAVLREAGLHGVRCARGLPARRDRVPALQAARSMRGC